MYPVKESVVKEVRWGIIGCGDVTEVKSGPAFNKISHSKLVAVMRRDRGKAADYARRHGVPLFTDNADEIMNNPDIDIVYIATPHNTHAHYAMQSARAKKAVYVEKPMARTYDECRKMIAACAEAGVPLYVAFYRRCMPTFLKVKELVESGTVGDIRAIQITVLCPPREVDYDKENPPWRVQPEINGIGGYFLDMGAHQFDLMDFILGPIDSACGFRKNLWNYYPADDTYGVVWQFDSGVIGSGIWGFSVSPHAAVDRTEIVGSNGSITFTTFTEAPVVVRTETGVEKIKIRWPEHVQQPIIATVIEECNGKRNVCPSTGVSAARTARVMDMILQERGGR
jgi:predicted dehydrogenase